MPTNVEGLTRTDDLDGQILRLREERQLILDELAKTCAGYQIEQSEEENALIAIKEQLMGLRKQEARKLCQLTEETHQVAAKTSSSIRQRDEEKIRLQRVASLLDRIEALQQKVRSVEAQLDSADLLGICKAFGECCVLAKDPSTVRGFEYRYGEGGTFEGRANSMRKIILDRLRGEEEALQMLLPTRDNNLDAIMERVYQSVWMYASIGCGEAGLSLLSRALQRICHAALTAITDVSSTLDFRYAIRMGKIEEYIVALGNWHQARLAAIELPVPHVKAETQVMDVLWAEVELAAVRILRQFVSERNVSGMLETLAMTVGAAVPPGTPHQQSLSIRELDLMVAELVLLCKSALTLLSRRSKSIRRLASITSAQTNSIPPAGPLLALLQELLRNYAILEIGYATHGISMAITMDETTEGEGVSTCVDDVFFLARKCATRALAVGETECILEVLEGLCLILQKRFIAHLAKNSRSITTATENRHSGLPFAIAVNDLASSAIFMERLVDELRSGIDENTGQLYCMSKMALWIGYDGGEGGEGGEEEEEEEEIERERPLEDEKANSVPVRNRMLDNLSRSKLDNALNSLDALADTMESLTKSALEHLYNSIIKSKCAPSLTQLFRETPNQLVVETLPVARIANLIDRFVVPAVAGLSEENASVIYLLLARELVVELENSILHSKYDGTGASILVRNVRKLASLFSEHTRMQSRDIFTRPTQMISLLDCGSRAEAVAAMEATNSSDHSKLTELEVRTLLSARQDW